MMTYGRSMSSFLLSISYLHTTCVCVSLMKRLQRHWANWCECKCQWVEVNACVCILIGIGIQHSFVVERKLQFSFKRKSKIVYKYKIYVHVKWDFFLHPIIIWSGWIWFKASVLFECCFFATKFTIRAQWRSSASWQMDRMASGRIKASWKMRLWMKQQQSRNWSQSIFSLIANACSDAMRESAMIVCQSQIHQNPRKKQINGRYFSRANHTKQQ